MTSDDSPVGHLLSRRQVITLLGATGALGLMGGGLFSRQSFASTHNSLLRGQAGTN